MNNALGQYAIGGRLGDSIRERQGMAYYVFSSFDANVVEGPLFVRAGVNPSNVERAIGSIDAELRRNDGGAHVVERTPELARVGGELGGVAKAMARSQPVHHLGVERLDDEQVHRGRGFLRVCTPKRMQEWNSTSRSTNENHCK